MQNKQQILQNLDEMIRLASQTKSLMTASPQPERDPLNLPWMLAARRMLGVMEIPGAATHPLIAKMQALTRYHEPHGDETPWCAAAVGYWLHESGHEHTASAAARSYLKYGDELSEPRVGCIVVFERGSGGHVGFLYTMTDSQSFHILGGNQGNEVSIKKYPRTRVLKHGYRWPVKQGEA